LGNATTREIVQHLLQSYQAGMDNPRIEMVAERLGLRDEYERAFASASSRQSEEKKMSDDNEAAVKALENEIKDDTNLRGDISPSTIIGKLMAAKEAGVLTNAQIETVAETYDVFDEYKEALATLSGVEEQKGGEEEKGGAEKIFVSPDSILNGPDKESYEVKIREPFNAVEQSISEEELARILNPGKQNDPEDFPRRLYKTKEEEIQALVKKKGKGKIRLFSDVIGKFKGLYEDKWVTREQWSRVAASAGYKTGVADLIWSAKASRFGMWGSKTRTTWGHYLPYFEVIGTGKTSRVRLSPEIFRALKPK
jgi:hypothetical protein